MNEGDANIVFSVVANILKKNIQQIFPVSSFIKVVIEGN